LVLFFKKRTASFARAPPLAYSNEFLLRDAMLSRRKMLAVLAALSTGAAAAPGDQDGDLVGGADVSTGSVPMRLDGGVLLDVSINGRPDAPFLFDTGATLTTLDAAYAASIGLTPVGGTEVRGANGGVSRQGMIEGVTLRAGAVALPLQDVGCIKLPNGTLDHGRRPRVAGLIGLNGFGPASIKIDLSGGRLLLGPSGYAADPWSAVVPLATTIRPPTPSTTSVLFGAATVEAALDGVKLKLMVDTGFGGVLKLHDHCVRHNGLMERYAKHIDWRTPGGLDGPLLTSMVSAGRLEIGGVAINQPIVALAREAAPPPAVSFDNRDRYGLRSRFTQPARETIDGLLGMGALARFAPVVDATAQRLILTRTPAAAQTRPVVWRSAGLGLDKPAHDHFLVLSTIAGTAAAAQGLPEGGQVVAVNDIPATDLSLGDYGRLERAGPITVRLAGGPSHTLSAIQLLP
jgi:predicted aspartyl protease